MNAVIALEIILDMVPNMFALISFGAGVVGLSESLVNSPIGLRAL